MYTGVDFGFGAVQIVSLVLSLIALGANVWMLVDACQRPDWAHAAAGSSKGLWIGLGAGSLVLCLCCSLLAGIAPIVWLAAFRSKVIDAEQRGPGGYGGFGGPPGGFGGPPGYGPPGPPPGYGPPTEWGQPGGGHPPFGGGPRQL